MIVACKLVLYVRTDLESPDSDRDRHRPVDLQPSGIVVTFILPTELLQRLPFRLRHQQSEQRPQEIHTPENNQRILHPNPRRVTRIRQLRILALRRVQEPERPHYRPRLAGRRRYSMAGGPEPGRENLRRHDEGGGVGAEVGEEEGEGVHDDEADPVGLLLPVIVGESEGEHEDGHHEESHQLDEESADVVDEGDGEPVAGDGAAEGDQSLGAGDLEAFLEGAHGGRRRQPLDRRENVLLEQVLAVEGDIQEKPRGRGPH